MAERETEAPEVEDSNDLYALAPEQFTAARDALVRRLRRGGDRSRAEQVRRLRRPSALAWALNRVSRDHPALVASVLEAGSQLREATAAADGRGMREAERSMRHAADAVVDGAARLLDGSGHPPTEDIRARMTATLRAAVVDPEVAARLRSGTLERDVEAPGFGIDEVAAAPQRPRQPRPSEAERRDFEERRRQEDARRAARARLSERENEAKRLAARAERLAASADRAEEEAGRARAEATAARAQADDAAARASAAREELERGSR